MRAFTFPVLFITATLAIPVAAQMHHVSKPQQVVRAIGVYEWTGDFAKPTASRLIPVSLFIDGKLEDAGVYTARPVPFALLSGNVYMLQTAGLDKGSLDLAYARHLQAVQPTGDMAYDDGWFGYGSVKPLAAPRRTTAALKPSKTLPVITATPDPNRPHLVTKPSADSTTASGSDQSKPASTQPTPATGKPDTTTASGTATGATGDDADRPTMKRRSPDASTSGTSSGTTTSTTSTPADDPDRPTMKRRTSDSSASGSDTTAQTGNVPADDPDRPTMKRTSPPATDGGTTTDTASTTTSENTSSDDPDRPTLKRHTPEDAKKAGLSANVGGNGSVEALNEDPNRPNLHHGKPTSSMTEEDLPKLTGIPPNLHQMVAVSDAVNRDPHPFTLEWDDEAQHQAILQKMQAIARAQLAAYGTTRAAATPAAAKKTTPTRSRRTAAPTPPLVPLLDEQLKAYTLSYGGDPTYVYSANTGGAGAALRYVTIVAQSDSLGEIKPAIQSVTDAAHLYRTPRMQFVDVVDAEASNRASLLFELRSQNVRQFALYRVIAAHPEQIFLTGTTQ
ncbi:MAG TPA: hypothetical protein VHW70_09615 [Edaphobacter sp.]|nr:hypothetical protein [Edaphobacter sp.]